VHSVKKSLAEHGDKVDADEKAKIEAALKDAEEAMKGDDKDAIEAKPQALAQASQKLGEKMYAEREQGAAAARSRRPAGGRPAARRARRTTATWSTPSSTEVKDKK
jgi:molecular chaperone DnaK